MAHQPSPRELYGIEKLSAALEKNGYEIEFAGRANDNNKRQVIIGTSPGPLSAETGVDLLQADKLSKEGFTIRSSGKKIYVRGADISGTLYGCMELAERVGVNGRLPRKIDFSDRPEMVMRGTCIGLQKTTYLPGRRVYEYPYTPENFPWFYDKELWLKYLDMMAENRFNSLYLWNGHPFASLVKLEDYPYAVEVDEETFRRNREIFEFLTKEADRRGIWIIQTFYNIIVSKPFAEHHNLRTQDRSRPVIPLIADYTRKSIAAFIENYPNTGLMITLGEAMNSVEDDVLWFTETILPGVKDGLKALGRSDEPPVVLRGHDTDAGKVMAAALPVYKNLYTMFKYNGESLTTYEPRDSWERIPRALSETGSVHISNVHILANLEPFRYGSPDFIHRCTDAMINIQGAKGLHLYPQASYWDWPYSADKTEPRLYEMDRDRIWYMAWARYAWNSERDRKEEMEFWGEKLGAFYGCGNSGKLILEAYEETGEIAPKLLRTFGISDGNRQTLLLGMFMSQLVNPLKYNVYPDFWSSSGPPKEILSVFAEKEFKGQPHEGETPLMVIEDVVKRGAEAVSALEKAAQSVTLNREEFERLGNDIKCYNALANNFAEKVRAALLVLRYQYSGDHSDLEKAVPHLQKSLEYYQYLVRLTEATYLYANSMQTTQRRIPVSGTGGKNKTWKELLPQYRKELENFIRNTEKLRNTGSSDTLRKEAAPLIPAEVRLHTGGVQLVPLREGEMLYTDRDFRVRELAGELKNLSFLKMSNDEMQDNGISISFSCEKPVKVVAGYFNGHSNSILAPPTLETDATANDNDQADMRMANAVLIPGLFPVNIYTYAFPAGKNELKLGRGQVLILGFIDGDQEFQTIDAGLNAGNLNPIDWLFY
ncbi:MAG: hypothetical protein JXR66_13555 [Bacteroidales bacterium]|nr:hypothetical protein [Bacteroidales bacterium]